MMPADPFNTSIGHFWGILDTRDYMRAHYGHLEALGKIQTRSSVEVQLDIVRDILRLNRSDNVGVRDRAPHLILRMNKDQECYDFLK